MKRTNKAEKMRVKNDRKLEKKNYLRFGIAVCIEPLWKIQRKIQARKSQNFNMNLFNSVRKEKQGYKHI